jgi:hypothetical protein
MRRSAVLAAGCARRANASMNFRATVGCSAAPPEATLQTASNTSSSSSQVVSTMMRG